MIERFERTSILRGRRWYFRVKAPNGEIVAQSEGYNSAAGREKGIKALRKAVHDYDTMEKAGATRTTD